MGMAAPNANAGRLPNIRAGLDNEAAGLFFEGVDQAKRSDGRGLGIARHRLAAHFHDHMAELAVGLDAPAIDDGIRVRHQTHLPFDLYPP